MSDEDEEEEISQGSDSDEEEEGEGEGEGKEGAQSPICLIITSAIPSFCNLLTIPIPRPPSSQKAKDRTRPRSGRQGRRKSR